MMHEPATAGAASPADACVEGQGGLPAAAAAALVTGGGPDDLPVLDPSALDPEQCWRALRARDGRFDGRFFVGVSSTRIYCRPVCRVRTPKAVNCRWFPSAAAAEGQGFRPCLRCRPELAPGFAAVDATHRLALAAARLIDAGIWDDGGASAVAARLGTSERHLRRVFDAQFGVSPLAWEQARRMLLAKRLLTDTALPVTEIAFAAGFGSVRRFNAAFRERYRLAPSELRVQAEGRPQDRLAFRLAYRAPYDWPRLLGFLAMRGIEGVESIGDGEYRRTVRLPAPRDGAPLTGWVVVRPVPGHDQLEAELSTSLAPVVPAVLARLREVFDLDCSPDAVSAGLGDLAAARPGLRLPRAWDGFEITVRAVLGQQITVKAARTLAGRFAARFGDPVDAPYPGLARAFPAPAAVAAADVDAIASLGVIATRSRTILALARALAEGQLALDGSRAVDETVAALRALPGIGDWTAQYIAMRALGWPDAFPASDYGVMKALGVTTPAQALRAAEGWRPWRAYAVIHLWTRLGEST